MTLNCFSAVKEILDEIYPEISGMTDAAKNRKIKVKLESLRKRYRTLEGNSLDFSRPETRFAYVYTYMASHADFACQLIEISDELSQVFRHRQVMISCIGGGPGSDVLGALKYATTMQRSTNLRFLVLDNEPAWHHSWDKVQRRIETKVKFGVGIQPIDVVSPLSWSHRSAYLNADLFTISYFVSEIYRRRCDASLFFLNLFRKAKRGARFLYIDNNRSDFYEWFDSLVRICGLTVCESNAYQMNMPYTEDKQALGDYFKRFGPPKSKANIASSKLKKASPKLTADIAYRVCVKG
jgi:hypothetical protein